MTSPPLIRELKILTYIQPRMNLSATQQANLHRLCKGYEGEKAFIHILEKELSADYLIVNDCLFKINNREFQIDTLLIGENTIYLLEIKNYKDDFYIQNNNWYSAASNNEIRNPLHQLKRSKLSLEFFLRQHGFNLLLNHTLHYLHKSRISFI